MTFIISVIRIALLFVGGLLVFGEVVYFLEGEHKNDDEKNQWSNLVFLQLD